MPLKLLALVMAGLRLRLELSESVLLHGRGSPYFGSFSELLWRLLAERPSFSLEEQRSLTVTRECQQYDGVLTSRWARLQ